MPLPAPYADGRPPERIRQCPDAGKRLVPCASPVGLGPSHTSTFDTTTLRRITVPLEIGPPANLLVPHHRSVGRRPLGEGGATPQRQSYRRPWRWLASCLARSITTVDDTNEAKGQLDRADADDEFPGDFTEGMLGAVRFDGLTSTAFEEFCFDLLSETGFVNVDWRKGTPKDSSPADRGRDIVAHLERGDVDGHQYMETWFIDCKHYQRGVPPEALQGTITWAQAERPSTVLFVASGYFTNGAKDWIATYEKTHPPFRIRTWEMPQLRRLANHMDVAFRHDVQTETLRRVSDILAAEAELFDRLWYGRKPGHDQPVPEHCRPTSWRACGPPSVGSKSSTASRNS